MAINLVNDIPIGNAGQRALKALVTRKQMIGFPLNTFREATAFDVANIAANGGVLASDSTPLLEGINGATDGCQRLVWAASNNDQIVNSVPLPLDLDTSKNIELHVRIASGGTTDAVGFTVASFFNEADTSVADSTTTNQTVSYLEKVAVIAASDIPEGAQTLSIGLTPVAHTTDTLNLTAAWLEYTPHVLET